MAKVSYIELPVGFQDLYNKGLQPGDRFYFSRVRVKDLFLSRTRVKGITQRSQLVALSPVWQGFDSTTKNAWELAGDESHLTGWKQFVVDTCERLKSGLTGYATPDILHQSEVGRILVQSPATGLMIEQAHPNKYFVQRKVTGTRSQYIPVEIDEPFGLPLEIKISWKTALTPIDGEARARFFCIVYSLYQGRTIENVVEIPFGMTDDWQRSSATLSTVLGPIKGYTAFIEVYNARGDLYFDNLELNHNGENWARDPYCNNVSQAFTKAFQQVAKHWSAVNISDGADFGSYYPGS